MKVSNTPIKTREVAGHGDKDTVVQDDGKEHGEHSEERHGASRNLEGAGEVSVHGGGLLEGEGALLAVGGV